MVFSDRAVGPFTRASVADAEHGYGQEKRLAEARVLAQNPAAVVVRLGWQIGFEGGNVMVAALSEQMRERGEDPREHALASGVLVPRRHRSRPRAPRDSRGARPLHD